MVVRISETSSTDNVGNIRIVPAAFEGDTATIFHPLLLDRLRGFKILIFDGWLLMDDNAYNSNTQVAFFFYLLFNFF